MMPGWMPPAGETATRRHRTACREALPSHSSRIRIMRSTFKTLTFAAIALSLATGGAFAAGQHHRPQSLCASAGGRAGR